MYTDEPTPLTLSLQTPHDKDDHRPIYLAGNFNNWRAADPAYRLEADGEGNFHFRFSMDQEFMLPIEYKYMRGDWSGAEIDRYGNEVPNRIVRHRHLDQNDYVPRWRFNGESYRPDRLPQVRVISDAFDLPGGIRTRRVAALLPYDYDQTDRRYPVLYLQDGQNLFDEHAPYGNWDMLRQLANLNAAGRGDFIVVAIDHAENERVEEFTPSFQTKLGVGAGKKYVRYLREVVKPFVDRHFRTLPDRANTGIGGSSMGGLISIYAGLMYPDCYSKMLIFSPSLWVAPNIYRFKNEQFAKQPTRIYLYAGGKESAKMMGRVKRFKTAIERNCRDCEGLEFQVSINPDGKHSEYEWGREFPRAAEWLFYGK